MTAVPTSASGTDARDPALAAIRRRRGRFGGRVLLRTLGRVVVYLIVLAIVFGTANDVFDGSISERDWTANGGLDLALALGAIYALVGGLGYVLLPLLRVVRARARASAPSHRFRPYPGIGSWWIATWWAPAIQGIAIESRSNNYEADGILALDLVIAFAYPVIMLLARRARRLELDATGIRYVGPASGLELGVIPDAMVTPMSYEDQMTNMVWPLLIGVGLLAGLTTGTYWALLLGFGILAVWMFVRAAARVDLRWTWSEVRLVALDGGNRPALQVGGASLLELSAFLRDTSANESLPWTIAEFDGVGSLGEVQQTTMDDQVLALLRAGAEQRPDRLQPGTPVALGSKGGAMRPTTKVGPWRYVFVAAILGLYAYGAVQGSVESLVVITSVLLILGLIVAYLVLRRARVQLTADASGLQLRELTRTTSLTADQIGAIVVIPVESVPTQHGTTIAIDGFVVDRSGAFILRLKGGDWPIEAIQSVADAIGVPAVGIEQPVSMTSIAAALPDYGAMWEREPAKFAFIIVGIIVVGVVVGVFAWQMATGTF